MFTRRSFLFLSGLALAAPRLLRTEVHSLPSDIDHILLGVSDLDHGIDWVEQRTGVRAAVGGVHPGRGTRNALLSLGPRCYLEIIAPDPRQPLLPPAQPFAGMHEPRLFNWAVHTDDIEAAAKKAVAAGFAIEGVAEGSRSRPDGKTLRWKTCRLKDDHGGLLPFFIRWDHDSVHPAADAPKGCVLERFFALTPHVPELEKMLRVLGVDLPVAPGKIPALQAVIRTAEGKVEI